MMRKFWIFSLGFCLFFALGAGISFIGRKEGDFWTFQKPSSSFHAARFPLKNRPFAIVVIGANNGGSVEKTLESVFSQNYDRYRLIYIDDASDDGSFDVAEEAIFNASKKIPVSISQNERRIGMLSNLFRAVQTIEDSEIVLVLHGEDFLAHEWVLQRLNAYYEDPNLWVALAKATSFPEYKDLESFPMDAKSFRLKPHLDSCLKTFYAALFKRVKDADFIYSGDFFPAAAELAYMAPILEMAEEHFCFIDETLYVRNTKRVYSEDKELKARCEQWVRALPPYEKLKSF